MFYTRMVDVCGTFYSTYMRACAPLSPSAPYHQDGEGAAAAAAAVGLLLRAAGVRGAPGTPPASRVVRCLAVLGRLPPEGCFISCPSSLQGEEVREAGGDAGGEECSVAADGTCAARRFAFCRAFFAFLLSCFVL